ncbi:MULTISPECIES: helix-turn-helix domain-containing protein [Niastella]|uniref:Helix-turn-helix transcriptional regulator n=1 Tax=Niastella soli TaxID=2821487 RepID=A0ABS3Z355_9BACT|nr:AraC family transcriptional regulator [Niastella soli]MBO9204603.1 helix-turn-helix transcriptional regulator [Niastella soli]
METLFRPGLDDEDDYPSRRSEEESTLQLQKALRRLDAYIDKCVANVKADIDNNPHKRKRVSYYASRTGGIDQQDLASAFKNKYKVTISQYQFQKRVELAAKLLRDRRVSLERIATKCGYSNTNTLSKAFKKAYNQTPINYLNSL